MAVKDIFTQGLISYRDRENLTQKQAAERVGLGTSRYAQFETGAAIPPPEVALRLANVCGMDPVAISFWALETRIHKPSYQELYLEENARFTPQVMLSLREARNKVELAGVSCIRQIRYCLNAFKELVASGGELRVILCDPTTKAFRERRAYESKGDGECLSEEGITTLRLDFEIRASLEPLKALRSASVSNNWRGKIRLRLYRTIPRASIIITDRTMAYMYEYRERHEGPKKPVKICWDAKDNRFSAIEDTFDEIWESGEEDIEWNQFAPESFTLPLFPVDRIMNKGTKAKRNKN